MFGEGIFALGQEGKRIRVVDRGWNIII